MIKQVRRLCVVHTVKKNYELYIELVLLVFSNLKKNVVLTPTRGTYFVSTNF